MTESAMAVVKPEVHCFMNGLNTIVILVFFALVYFGPYTFKMSILVLVLLKSDQFGPFIFMLSHSSRLKF